MVFRIQLSLSVVRFKQMVEAQEGFGVGEQELFFQGSQVIALRRAAFTVHSYNRNHGSYKYRKNVGVHGHALALIFRIHEYS